MSTLKHAILCAVSVVHLSATQFNAIGELALNDYTLEELQSMSLNQLLDLRITSSTGIEQRLSEAPSIATVITAEQIQRSSARTLSEVLSMVPALKVYTPSVNLGSSSYDIRGLKTGFNSQMLFLMNGTAMNNLFSSSPLLGFNFPASAIKRIEVVRGPGSAVYGADAFAGTINIITKDAQYLGEKSQAGVRYGSYDSAEVFTNYGYTQEELSLGVNLSYMTSNGDSSRKVEADLQTTLDGIFNTSASQAPDALHTNYELLNLNLNLLYKDFEMNLWGQLSEKGTNAGIANALDFTGSVEQEALMGDFIYRYELSSELLWENKLSLTYLNNEMNYGTLFPAGTVLPVGDDGNIFTSGGGLVNFSDGLIGRPAAKEYWAGIESSLYIQSIEDHDIRLSVGYSFAKLEASEKKNFGPGILNGSEGTVNGSLTDVTGTPYVYSPDVNRKRFFLSLQDEYSLSSALLLTTGLRYDNYSDFGDTLNPRLGLVWKNSETFTSKLLYGRAFRAPSTGELYWKNNPAILGNEEVQPESIDTIEMGFAYRANKNFHANTNVYWYEANDLISTVPTNLGQKYENVGRQHGAGLELELDYQFNTSLLLSADYAYRWTKSSITNEAVAGIPKHISHINADYTLLQNLHVTPEVLVVADTPRAQGDTREKISSYALLNLAIGYKFNKDFEITIAARNLLDKSYVDPSDADPVGDFPMPGLNAFAELSYNF